MACDVNPARRVDQRWQDDALWQGRVNRAQKETEFFTEISSCFCFETEAGPPTA